MPIRCGRLVGNEGGDPARLSNLNTPPERRRSDREKLVLAIEDRWLSVDEIAAHLGVKRDTVYTWIGERQMPAHKVGRLWKFQRAEVDEWVRGGGAENRSSRKKRGK